MGLLRGLGVDLRLDLDLPPVELAPVIGEARRLGKVIRARVSVRVE